MKNSVCYKCADRVVGCHSTCRAYLEEAESNKKKKDIYKSQRDIGEVLKHRDERISKHV